MGTIAVNFLFDGSKVGAISDGDVTTKAMSAQYTNKAARNAGREQQLIAMSQ